MSVIAGLAHITYSIYLHRRNQAKKEQHRIKERGEGQGASSSGGCLPHPQCSLYCLSFPSQLWAPPLPPRGCLELQPLSLKCNLLPVAVGSKGGNEQDAFSLGPGAGKDLWRSRSPPLKGGPRRNQARLLTSLRSLENFYQGQRGIFYETPFSMLRAAIFQMDLLSIHVQRPGKTWLSQASAPV